MNETLRYSLDSFKRASELGYPWSVSPEEARVLLENSEALLAENISLRAQIQMLQEHRESCVASLLKGYETGKSEERPAVVAWLRERHVDTMEWDGRVNAVSHTYGHAAKCIERGEHRREEQ